MCSMSWRHYIPHNPKLIINQIKILKFKKKKEKENYKFMEKGSCKNILKFQLIVGFWFCSLINYD